MPIFTGMSQKIVIRIVTALILLMNPVALAANWEEPSKGTLTARTGVIAQTLELEIKKADNSIPASKLQYKPAPSNRTFVSLGYANFGLSGSVRNPTSDVSDAKYGTTSSTDFQFRFFGKYASHEIFYQRYKGYYLENTGDVTNGYDTNSARLQNKDMNTEAVGINITYNFNPESYSPGSMYDSSTKAKSSGGAWLATASLNKHLLSTPSTLVLGTANGSYEGFENLRLANVYTAALGGGGGYVLAAGGFYLGAQVMLSLGYEKQYLEYQGAASAQYDSAVLKGIVRLGLGYNGENFLAGVAFNNDSNSASIAKTSVAFNTTEATVFAGYRFTGLNMPFLDKWSDRLFN